MAEINIVAEIESATDPKIISRVQIAALKKGVSQNFLAEFFKKSQRTINNRINNSDIQPIGERHGSPVYDMADACNILLDGGLDISEYVRLVKKNELPPLLNSDFWKAQTTRQLYEEKANNLWRTERVFEMMIGVLKLIREEMLIWDDLIEQQTGLNHDQRAVFCALKDSLINKLGEMIKDYAEGWDGVDKDQLCEDEQMASEIELIDDLLAEKEE